jgi:hypothetical protein
MFSLRNSKAVKLLVLSHTTGIEGCQSEFQVNLR